MVRIERVFSLGESESNPRKFGTDRHSRSDPRQRHSGVFSSQNHKCGFVLSSVMAICPHCDSDISDWANRLEKAPAANTPKVWTCPDCDSVLGISDWGSD